jgi:cysteine protease ATG4
LFIIQKVKISWRRVERRMVKLTKSGQAPGEHAAGRGAANGGPGRGNDARPPPSTIGAMHSSRAPPTPTTPGGSKLPKFMQTRRDRARSDADATAASASPSASSSRLSAPIPIPETPRRAPADDFDDDGDDEPPVVIDPALLSPSAPTPRARARAERVQPSLSAYGSPGKIAELPTRLSGWFSHAFGGSATDLSLPALLQQHASSSVPTSSVSSPASSRARAAPNALLVAAKHGKGHLDKAMRYLLDSDATPDNATEPIWLLGVLHSAAPPPPPPTPDTPDGRRSRSKLRGGSADSLALPSALAHAASVAMTPKHPGAHWPRAFYADFSSRVWCTYRSQFQPIRDSTLSALEAEIGGAAQPGTSPTRRTWWGAEKGWTSDAGWGCMLRTGQSLLANALLHLHLGRGERPVNPLAGSS